MHVLKSNGQLVELDIKKIQAHAAYACEGLSDVSQSELETDSHITFYEGMPTSEIQQTLILTAADKIKDHYNWHYVAARLLLLHLFKQVTDGDLVYPSLRGYVETGIQVGGLDPDLLTNGFDFDALEQAIDPRRDRNFTYLGLSILADRYFRRNIHTQKIIELPQHFYMRVAMGLTLKGTESNPTEAAIEFYHQLSSFDFHNSTPTLFNSGTITPQLSSCYLLSMGDSIEGINGTCGEAAHYSKLSGGIGIDMTPVRSDGSLIAGTGGRSGGVIPFMKMAESTIAAFNQMGKRKGAGCLYLADFHPDIEAFLKLKNETGDPRERIPDLQTAIWHSEIFLQRKDDPDALFSLIDPHDVPELLETYGEEFNRVYLEAEAAGKYRKQVNAKELWKKMVNAAYETSSYFMGNKDMINRRSMQKDTGIVRSSNLCCITADQRVSTNLGLLTVGELYELQKEVRVPGLIGHDNASVMYLPRPDAPIVKIHTKEGYTHKVTPDHKVWVRDKGWVEAQDLVAGDKLLIQQVEGEFGPNDDVQLAMELAAKENASVPEYVWKGTKNVAIAYLSCFGYSEGFTNIRTSSKEHAEQLQILLANLGICTGLYIDVDDNWRVVVQRAQETEFVCLEPQPNEDAYCLTVDSDTHAWTVNGLITKNTEITLNTIPNEVSAVCNIGSINLANYTGDDGWLKRVVTIAVRMLDNVVSIGLVPHANGRKFQDRERAIGLGLMGETEWLVRNGISFDSMEHLEATALLMKKISRFAIEASADLAQERGSYELFAQSEWAKGVLPYDTAPKEALELLPTSFEWYYEDDSELRAKTSKGMRNSHIMAIAPTATISHIVGTTSCTELPLELITVEENLSGNFISRSPVLKHILMEDAQTARDVDQVWVIRAAAVRQVYIDQAQSTNMYIPLGMEYADGTKVTGSVISGWRDLAMKVLKTVYYLRGVSAGAKKRELSKEQVFCSIDNPQECEACQ